ncbi:MAG TPA: hypothetical protein VFA19_04370 [Gaiellaceae bacterium]|nr:hypothetical protein [Gaiellaceae bacterium]
MAGISKVALVAACVALLAAASATAAPPAGTPDVSAMTLQAEDFPGGASAAGRASAGTGPLVGGYERQISLSRAYGASHYRVIDSVAFLTTDAKVGAQFYALLGHEYSSKAGRQKLVKEFLKDTKVSAKSVSLVKPRALGVSDSSMEMGFLVKTKATKVNVSVSLLRLDRVVLVDIAIGNGTAVSRQDGIALTKLGAAHIAAALVPIDVSRPTITGTPAQGQTLTAAPGGWGDTPSSYAYQWQRCDASGGSCADVAGATGTSYAVTSADAGATLRVDVVATNRFGSVPATSAVTSVVS